MTRPLAGLILVLSLFPSMQQAETKSAGPELEAPMVIPLQPFVGRLRSMEADIGGESYPFIFDTGGGFTVITPEVAELIRCEPAGRVTGYRANGERINTRLCPEVDLTVDGSSLSHEFVGIFDIMALLPDGLPDLGGLVSLQSFMGRTITLDLAGGRLVVENAESRTARIQNRRPLPVRWATGPGGAELVPYLSVATPRGKLWMMLDSGNMGEVLLAPHAAELLGLDVDPALSEGRTYDDVELRIDGLGTVRVTARVSDLIHDGLLSAAWMEEWLFTMDLDALEIWAAPAASKDR